ncbi:hypothetical protein Patl1_27837 [Pistacia atlantica]|uniref:Uncharacterized protein n=1 Tax=Pistacia atlantica TaxID=434234 RepID=A0ACC1BDZ1_9ROSI|nr:hypothetical protein Patl1_27837 [Pistacia atlantica]
MVILFFLLLFTNFLATTQQGHSSISLDSSLSPTGNSSWLSPSGLYGFEFYQRGNGFSLGVFIAGIPQKTVVWSANRDKPPVPGNVTLHLTGGGSLMLQSADGQEASIVTTSVPIAKASMFDSGNFVLYNSAEGIIWQSFRNATDTILPGQGLLAREELYSSVSETDQSTGSFRLTMQGDGNLVQYPKDAPYEGPYCYYSSSTPQNGDNVNVSLNLDIDGHLYLRFAVSEEGCRISGSCQKNFSIESCESKDGNIMYTIERVANTIWEDSSYSIVSLPNNEECEKACLEDCICVAAIFKDGKCKKQKLPLRFGRKLNDESNIALIKVGVEDKRSKKERREDLVIVSVSLLIFAFIIFIIFGVLVFRNRVHAYKRISNKIRLDEDFKKNSGLKSFTYLELLNVTNNFTEEIGRGAFGTVFRGEISHNQKVITVKRLERVSTDGEREFQTEMKAIGKTHHRNLVRLLGYCHEGPNRLLVYEYMSNGSLAEVDKLQLERMVKVGLWCFQYEPSLRASMKTVVLMLDGIADIPFPPNPTSFS